MGRYMCIVKNWTWGRLFYPGDVTELPVGATRPYGTSRRSGKEVKIPYFKFIQGPKKAADTSRKRVSARSVKTLKNRLTALLARTNLTDSDKAEKERILARLADIDTGKSPQRPMTKEEVVKKKEAEVAVAAGPQAMSMAETQAMKHAQHAEAKAKNKKG